MKKLMISMFNFALFGAGDVVNATGGYVNANTGAVTEFAEGGNLSAEMKTFYSDYLIDMTEPKLVHAQFGQKRPIPKNGGKTVEYRKYDSLPKLTTPLSEGVTPTGQKLNVTTVTDTVQQYGGFTEITDVISLTAIDPIMTEAVKLLGSQAGRTLDTIVRDKLNAGTNVQYGDGTVTARNLLTGGADSDNDYLTVDCIRRAVRALKVQNTEPINGDFVAIIHPDVAYDLMNDPAWELPHQYTDTENIYNGELGKIAGVRFVETTEAKIFEGAGAGGRSVYSTLIIGDNAYGITEITGGGLEHIYKPFGSAGTSDPLNQRASAGWKALLSAIILVQQYMIRIETASTFESAAN